MPVYTLVLRPTAEKEIGKIPSPYKERVALAVRELAYDPRPRGYKKLTGKSLYRIRVGIYRVIYAIDDTIVTVTVTKAAHRGKAYKS